MACLVLVLTINGMLSVGDWQWDSNATGYYYNGNELWCTGNGHGDCLHVGKFIKVNVTATIIFISLMPMQLT